MQAQVMKLRRNAKQTLRELETLAIRYLKQVPFLREYAKRPTVTYLVYAVLTAPLITIIVPLIVLKGNLLNTYSTAKPKAKHKSLLGMPNSLLCYRLSYSNCTLWVNDLKVASQHYASYFTSYVEISNRDSVAVFQSLKATGKRIKDCLRLKGRSLIEHIFDLS